MSEFIKEPQASTPEQLKQLLNSPDVKAMLDSHFSELAVSGILRVYTEHIRPNLLGSTPMSIQRTILDMSYATASDEVVRAAFDEYRIGRAWEQTKASSFEAPTLVLKQTLTDPEESDTCIMYSLEKVDPATGEFVPNSKVDMVEEPIGEAAEHHSQDDLDRGTGIFSRHNLEAAILRRHYDNQVATGIVYAEVWMGVTRL